MKGLPLPSAWVRRSTEDDETYYLNHDAKTTQCESPMASKEKDWIT